MSINFFSLMKISIFDKFVLKHVKKSKKVDPLEKRAIAKVLIPIGTASANSAILWRTFPNDVNPCYAEYFVVHVLSGHSKIDKTKILMTKGSFNKVESIAECSIWSILQYF